MTVKEMIEKLKKLDQNKRVVVTKEQEVFWFETLEIEEDQQDVIILYGEPSDCK